MTLSSLRPVAALGLVTMVLGYVGCTRTDEASKNRPATGSADLSRVIPTSALIKQEQETSSAEVGPADAPRSSPPTRQTVAPATTASPTPPTSKDPLAKLAAWTKKPPAAVLVVSGEQDGYLKPCGCTGGQLGGLGRRFDLFTNLRARGWPVAAVDLGNLIHNPAGSRGGPQQEKVKFDTALRALAAMNYAAVAIGPEDLKIGIGEFLGLLLNLKSPAFLSANLRPIGGFEEIYPASTIVAAGPVKLGLTAVIEPAAFQALTDPDKAMLFSLKSPEEALPPVAAQLEKDSAIQVLMVQGSADYARRLVARFPGFDLVVSAAKYDDPDARPEILNGGRTTLINVGRKGKYAGVVGLYPGSTPSVEFHLQPLEGTHFDDAEPMRALIDDQFPSILKAIGVVENFSRVPNTAYPTGATYAGAESCQKCHPNTFAKWSTTKHADAYAALTDPKRNREADAECISCHTTGFGYNTGWVSAEKTPYLKGNQCENCHGPGSLHNAEPDNLAYRQPMVRTAEVADKGGFCISCHNDDNDPHFNFAEYYPKIYHKGLDVYDDPKVHQKTPRKVANRTPSR